MPTFNIYIRHDERGDKKYPIAIRITQNKQHAYIQTGMYVVKQQLSKEFTLKDKDVSLVVLGKIREYEKMILQDLGGDISLYSAKFLRDHIEKKENTPLDIDFIAFARQYIKDLLKEGDRLKKTVKDRNKKEKRAKHIQSAINSFCDRFGDKFNIRELKSDRLKEFEQYLREDRAIVRVNQFGRDIKTKRGPLTNTGIHDYMTDIKCLFNAAKDKYNDSDNGIITITNDPFKKYKIPQTSKPSPRNTDINFIRKMISFSGSGNRDNLSRDMYMLSFFLVGINSVDLFEMKHTALSDGRLTYNRSKTEGRREDEALISIKIEPEAMEIIKRYTDPMKERLFLFHRMYATADGFNAAINKGLKQVYSAICGQNTGSLTYYSARHSWATIVHNILGYTEYDVAECLNHVIDGLSVTRGYIARDFSRIDKINREMIDFINKEIPD